MLTKTLVGAAVLAAAVRAEVAPGFPLKPGGNLTVIYGNDTVEPPGEMLPRAVTAQPPTIASPVWWATDLLSQPPAQCLLLMIDLDVPRNNTRVPLLHWLATNVSRSNPLSVNTTGTPLVIPSENPVPYLQPSPPVGDIPHTYTFILLRQPRNFSIPEKYSALAQNRVGFDLSLFLRDSGLQEGKEGEGEALASNWIRVQNTTGTPTTSAFPPARPSQTGGSESGNNSGGARGNGGVRIMGGASWVGIGTTVFAGVMAVML